MHFSPNQYFLLICTYSCIEEIQQKERAKHTLNLILHIFPIFFLFYIHERKLDSFNYICQLDIHNSAPTFCEVFLKQSIYIEAL